MINSKIIFAFAVNNANEFAKQHFGDVDKYLIYEYCNGQFSLISHQINTFKNLDEKNIHGSKEKGKSIIKLLKKNKVQVLVSPQFGLNIKMINKYFIPVALHNCKTENAFEMLLANMKWIIDELEINPTEYRLFSINTGIAKIPIK
ncbi:NifB/NifX family molybdenum-iron cluster-binding protein [Marinifilum sp. RC60d5]|uniref:NifB/NifX family molybdenum-iron cluster-binding protein n=1 Tax=Marinifilum sp. RC60d5 TaxID=3458414 RepID=UPI0040371277